ncbi:MAG TPA: hypothetical protein VIH25_09050 [Steroidobacteraceae bacterium]
MRNRTGRALGLAIIGLGASVALCAFADDKSANEQLMPLAFLAGYCWGGPFADGKATDEHCYEWMYGGRFLRDRHIVRGGEKPYRGETIFFWDGAENAVGYIYFNSDGGVSRGILKVEGEALLFPAERYTEGSTTREFSTTLVRENADSYYTSTRELKDGKWQEAWRVAYRRGGLTSAAEWFE